MCKRVIVIDDEVNICDALDYALTSIGYEVQTYQCPQTALTDIRKTKSDDIELIITDLMMPIMDGFTLIDKIRETHPDLPVLVITAYLEDETKERLNLLTGVMLQEKPLRLSDLRDAIDLILDKSLQKYDYKKR